MSTSPTKGRGKIREALALLAALEAPHEQRNERSALTLLALADLTPRGSWGDSQSPRRRITEMMDWMRAHYGADYAPNTRETIRRQTIHQFVQMGIVAENPDAPERPINSPKWCYQLTPPAVEILRTFGQSDFHERVLKFLETGHGGQAFTPRHRDLPSLPVRLPDDDVITLSSGGQNALIRLVIERFCPRFVPGGKALFIGDASGKNVIDGAKALRELGVELPERGKAPDLIVHDRKRSWLIVVEAVTSHGPIDQKRKNELETLLASCRIGLVFVTAFPDRKTFSRFQAAIAWETDVWIAEAPEHLIHFNGERFLGPY